MVNIDVRKLISFGKGSYIVSMPKSWVQKNNLKKGDLISVNDDGYELTLSANAQDKKSDVNEISIDAKGKNLELLKAEIISSYLNCYDNINILFDQNSSDTQKIKDIIRNLSGLEIMEQTSTRIVAKNLININEISIKNIVRRMDVITRAMMEDVILCSRNQCDCENIHQRDTDVNRLFFLGNRVIKNAMKNPRIARTLGIEPWGLHVDSLMILRLEKIADRQKRITRELSGSNLDRATLTEIGKMHTNICEAYNNVMKSYYNKDKQIAIQVEITNKDRTTACDKLLGKGTKSGASKSKQNQVAIAKIIENLKATTAGVRNIARTVLCHE